MKIFKADTKNFKSNKTGSVTFKAENWEAARKEVCRLMDEWRGNDLYYIEQVVNLTDIETGETFWDYLRSKGEA